MLLNEIADSRGMKEQLVSDVLKQAVSEISVGHGTLADFVNDDNFRSAVRYAVAGDIEQAAEEITSSVTNNDGGEVREAELAYNEVVAYLEDALAPEAGK